MTKKPRTTPNSAEPAPLAPQPPPPYTWIGVYAANPQWSIEWVDALGNVMKIEPITGWALGTRQSDGLDLLVPITAKYPIFFSQQTQPYRLVGPREQGGVVEPDPSK